MSIIIQKAIALSGLSSRRKAEEMVLNGSVKINGKKANVGQMVDIDKDIILVRNKKISFPENYSYFKLNKPKGYVCTNKSFKNEKNIFDLVDNTKRLFVIGRLDKNSRGLVILTNDGDLTQKISHPKYNHQKKYLVKVSPSVNNFLEIKKGFLKGIKVQDEEGLVKVENIKELKKGFFEIDLSEGKKRQIRKMFAKFNYKVLDLQRIEISGVRLGSLSEGKYEELSNNELKILKS